MSRLVLLEWDESQLRLLDARTSKTSVKAEQASVFPLSDGAENQRQQIAERLAQAKLGKAEAIVCVSRSDCQIRNLTIPLAPPEEVPEIVRFQAMRQFSGLSQETAIDFIVLDESPEHGIEVLAAAIAQEQIDQIKQTVQDAGLILKRIVLRPFAAASLFADAADAPVLLIDRSANETDLTVLADSKVMTTRTVRLSVDLPDEQYANMLAGEIRRTFAATKNQGIDVNVGKVLLLEDRQAAQQVASMVSQQLKLPVEIIDPFELTKQKGNIRQRPEDIASFSALLGSLHQHLADDADSVGRIDFLNPRHRVEDNTRQKQYATHAGIAGLALLTLIVLAYIPIHLKSKKIENLRIELSTMEEQDDQAKATMAQVKILDDWKNSEVVWLDELYYISYNLPPADRTIIDSLHFRFPARTKNPSVIMKGRMKGAGTVAEIENGLRDETNIHAPKGKAVKPIDDDKLYDHEFDQTITIAKEKLDAIRKVELEQREFRQVDQQGDSIQKAADDR